MFNRKAMVLYCGSPPADMAPASSASPGAGGSGLPEAVRSLWARNGLPCEGPPRRGLLAFAAAPHPLTGAGGEGGAARPQHAEAEAADARPKPTPTPLARPEEELDGCEPDADSDAESGGVPSTTASVASTEDEDEADELRVTTLEVVARYLRENAAAAAAEAPVGGKRGEGGKLAGRDLGPSSPCVARSLETLRRVGDGLLDKHRLAFQGMLRKMDIKKKDDLKIMSEVATHVFSDGITNWGRIVTLISFGAFVAKHLKSINQESSINTLAEIITDVLVVDKREWLVSHNSWEGFINFFHVEDMEGSIRTVLMAFAGVAGLGASLAYMIR